MEEMESKRSRNSHSAKDLGERIAAAAQESEWSDSILTCGYCDDDETTLGQTLVARIQRVIRIWNIVVVYA